MIHTDDQLVMDLQRLLIRCHTVLWLNCLDPVEVAEMHNQEQVEKLLQEIEDAIDLKDGDEIK